MSKFYRIFLVALFVVGGVVAVRFLWGGDEDIWLCEKGEWVKHGSPTTPEPVFDCGVPVGNADSNSNSTNAQVVSAGQFIGAIAEVSASEQSAMLASGSWQAGCPVPISDLRTLAISYWNFDGQQQSGKLMVHADVAEDVIEVFTALYDARFPIRRMSLVDVFQANDEASMEADNTSAFNCRRVSGSDRWSQHAFGTAIDLNPMENPAVDQEKVEPVKAETNADRNVDAVGMIQPHDDVVQAFSMIGWTWGGTWSRPIDYMHFSQSGT